MKFFVTFGQKWRYEKHPKGGHPEGYFVIEARDVSEARKLAFTEIGVEWAFMYDEVEFLGHPEKYYPRGELKRIVQGPSLSIS